MRILIISDTHRNHEYLEQALENAAPIDLLIHLGDAEGCEEEIANMAGCPMEIVAGNNDFFSDLEKELELKIGRYRVLLTHGHYYCVSTGLGTMKLEAEGRGIDIVMFGHTHRPVIEYWKNIVLLNPGSLSYPRQEGRRPSYILMELEEEGEAEFWVEYL